jgi:hypothetical protein
MVDDDTLETILKNIIGLDETFIKMARGELRLNEKHHVVDNEGKIDEKYEKIFYDSIKLRAQHNPTYDIQDTIYIAKQWIIHPIKQYKKTAYLIKLSKEIEKRIRE